LGFAASFWHIDEIELTRSVQRRFHACYKYKVTRSATIASEQFRPGFQKETNNAGGYLPQQGPAIAKQFDLNHNAPIH
jgi:hypothetical protein